MTQKVEGGSVRGVLTNLWLTAESAAAHVRCPEGKLAPRPCLIKAGTLLNIWLYFHHGTRDCEC
jgi:hypothetical protein